MSSHGQPLVRAQPASQGSQPQQRATYRAYTGLAGRLARRGLATFSVGRRANGSWWFDGGLAALGFQLRGQLGALVGQLGATVDPGHAV